MDVILAAGGGDVPLRDVPYTLGMFQCRTRHKCDVAECGSTKRCAHAGAGGGCRSRRVLQMVEIFQRDFAEFLAIIFRIEYFLTERLLAHNAIKKITAAGHAPT